MPTQNAAAGNGVWNAAMRSMWSLMRALVRLQRPVARKQTTISSRPAASSHEGSSGIGQVIICAAVPDESARLGPAAAVMPDSAQDTPCHSRGSTEQGSVAWFKVGILGFQSA